MRSASTAFLFVVFAAVASGQAPVLEAAATGVTDGHVQLAWEPSGDGYEVHEFQLVEAATAAFEETLLRYEGADQASFVSGLPAGDHFYRVRQRAGGGEWGAWSEPVRVEIAPHSLAVAWTLFSIGGVLVAAILAFLLVADHRARKGEV